VSQFNPVSVPKSDWNDAPRDKVSAAPHNDHFHHAANAELGTRRVTSATSIMKSPTFVYPHANGQPPAATGTEPSFARAKPGAKPPVIRSESKQHIPGLAPVNPEGTGKRRRQSHALLNKAQTLELNKAKKIYTAALRCRSVLQLRGISDFFLAGLIRQIEFCRQKSSEAMQQTILKENYTAEERLAKKALVKSIAEIQSAAKQKYARSQPIMLQDYCIGKDLDSSRAALEQYSQNIIEKLGGNPNAVRASNNDSPAAASAPADPLPGITPEKVAALRALRSKWMDLQTFQANSQALATGLRAERDALVQSITDQRIEIQFAAEAEWPASEAASAGKRRAFLLQPTRPFSLAA